MACYVPLPSFVPVISFRLCVRNPTLAPISPSIPPFYTPRAVAISPDTSPHHTLPQTTTAPTHLLTILTSTPTSTPLFPEIAAALSVAHVTLSPFRALSSHAFEASLILPNSVHFPTLRRSLFQLGRLQKADVILQSVTIAREPKRLAVFDLDSTLIRQETIDELAALVNAQQQVGRITEAAMNGEIGFRDALQQRVSLLRGLPVSQLERIKQNVKFTPGARQLVQALRRMGCKTAMISGGFHFLADHVRDQLGLHQCFANRLQVDKSGRLTGETVGEIVDAEFKKRTLNRLAREAGLKREQVLAVGDGSNDLLMMQSAGLGVAFNAKPIVQDRAEARINLPSLRNVLYLLGLHDENIDSLLED